MWLHCLGENLLKVFIFPWVGCVSRWYVLSEHRLFFDGKFLQQGCEWLEKLLLWDEVRFLYHEVRDGLSNIGSFLDPCDGCVGLV